MARAYFKQILTAVDQGANAIAGGWADETLSSRAWRSRDKCTGWGRAQRAIDAVFFWEDQHCYASFVSEQLKRQMPPELRGPPSGEDG